MITGDRDELDRIRRELGLGQPPQAGYVQTKDGNWLSPAQMQQYLDFRDNYWAPDRDEVLSNTAAGRVRDANAEGGWGYPGVAYATPQTPQAPQGGFNESALSQAWLASGGQTPADLARFIADHPELAQGVTIFGSKSDKLRLPDGRVVDAVLSAGLGGRGASWNIDNGSSGYSASSGFTTPAPVPEPFHYDPFVAPEAFSYEGWTAPETVGDFNDPGYSARLGEGQKALERAAAARGTLLTGGTLKDLQQYGQDYAANEYQNAYNRSLQQYMTNRSNAFENYSTNYQNALNAYKTNFDTAFQPWQANYNQAYQSWLGNYNAAQQGWQNEQFAQNQRFNQLYNTAQLGLLGTQGAANAAGQYGTNLSNLLSQYGQGQADLITGQGNARAAGQVGSANAWGSAFGNIGNNITMATLYGGLYGNQGQTGRTSFGQLGTVWKP